MTPILATGLTIWIKSSYNIKGKAQDAKAN